VPGRGRVAQAVLAVPAQVGGARQLRARHQILDFVAIGVRHAQLHAAGALWQVDVGVDAAACIQLAGGIGHGNAFADQRCTAQQFFGRHAVDEAVHGGLDVGQRFQLRELGQLCHERFVLDRVQWVLVVELCREQFQEVLFAHVRRRGGHVGGLGGFVAGHFGAQQSGRRGGSGGGHVGRSDQALVMSSVRIIS